MSEVKESVNESLGAVSPIVLSALGSVHATVVRRSQFAAAMGVSESVVRGWVANGYLPTISMGKYTLINMVRYRADLLAGVVPASYKVGG